MRERDTIPVSHVCLPQCLFGLPTPLCSRQHRLVIGHRSSIGAGVGAPVGPRPSRPLIRSVMPIRRVGGFATQRTTSRHHSSLRACHSLCRPKTAVCLPPEAAATMVQSQRTSTTMAADSRLPHQRVSALHRAARKLWTHLRCRA